MKHSEFITLARYNSLEEAQVIKALLDSTGIENQIINDTAALIMPYLENDVKIMVNGKDYDKARAILDAAFDRKGVIVKEKK